MKRIFSRLLASFTRSRSSRPLPARRKARLEVENLEGRELLSAAPLLSAFKLTPTVTVRDSGGTYNGRPFAASASATTVLGFAVSGTETFTYWSGRSASGIGSASAPTQAGTYTVVAAFTSSNPYYSNARSAPVTFTIAQATPTVAVTVSVTNTAPMEALVPAYFYPTEGGSAWDQLDAAARSVHVMAIMNPDSGPGAGVNSDYVSAVNKLQAAGGQVIGYVHTSYGAIPLATVEAQINEYRNWYHVNGVFIDEMTSDASAQHLQYYQAIYQYAHSLQSNWTVVGNPGTNTTEDYVRLPVADVLVTYEDSTGYGTYTPSSWQAKYSPSRFANIVDNVASVAAMQTDVNLAASRGTQWLYVTNLNGDNPYDSLPTYWNQFVSALASKSSVTAAGQPVRVSAKVTGVNGAAVPGFCIFVYYPGSSVHGAGSTTAPTFRGTYTVLAEFFSWDADYRSTQSSPVTFTIR